MDTGKVYVLTDTNTTTTTTNEGKAESSGMYHHHQGTEKDDADIIISSSSSGFNVVGGVPLSARSSSSSLSLPSSSSRTNGFIRDLSSGREMSLDEFGGILGYTTTTTTTTTNDTTSTPSQQQEEGVVKGDKATDWVQKSKAAWGASASWVKGRTQTVVQRMNSGGGGQHTGAMQSSSSSFGNTNTNAAAAGEGGGGGGISQWLASSSSAGAGGGQQQQPNLGRPSSTFFSHGSQQQQQHVFQEDGQGARVKVTTKQKQSKEFSDLRLVQTVPAHQGVVWTMKFSPSGKYLASAGQDGVIRVWEVNRNRNRTTSSSGGGSGSGGGQLNEEERDGGNAAAAVKTTTSSSGGGATEATVASTGADLTLAVLFGRPHRTYSGHKQDVLDLSWSHSHFLLSASMDKTVRLWHVSMDDCLRVFKHTDFVTAIDFHPLDDKLFISGSIDGKMRLWNIPEQRVVSWQDVHEMVTAVSYSPDGRKAVVGTMRGRCRFYGVEKNSLEYEAQLDVKNARGQHSRGKKITGLQFLTATTTSGGGKKAGSAGGLTNSSGRPGPLLITSNDSRIRLYEGYTLKYKYKGHTNRNTQIRASFSPGGEYVMCGSDDGWVYLWNTLGSHIHSVGNSGGGIQEREKVGAYECFYANGDTVTVAVFAPCAAHRSMDDDANDEIQPVGQNDAADDEKKQKKRMMKSDGGGARGQVIVTAGYTGELRIYENIGVPSTGGS